MEQSQVDTPRPKVLAVASFGGHLVQLMRMMRPFVSTADVAYVSTAEEGRPDGSVSFDVVSNFSRSNPWLAFSQIKKMHRIIKRERPCLVVTTGAAPGLLALMVAKTMGISTLWIDSVANADRLSMCGRIASRLADRTLTQWPHLATGRVEYHGNVL